MATLYSYTDVDQDRITVFDADIPGMGFGINIRTDRKGCSIPDDRIPDLISALQAYMSRRAREMAKGANGRT